MKYELPFYGLIFKCDLDTYPNKYFKQELSEDNGAHLMGACLSRLQTKLTYRWDQEI